MTIFKNRLLLKTLLMLCCLTTSLTQYAQTTNICELPADQGPCDDDIRRFYYDSNEGNCIPFSYGGCEGNANNFEGYIACIENACVGEPVCPEGEPVEWDWLKRRIEGNNQSIGCNASRISTFEANGTTIVSFSPGAHKICATDQPVRYYTCKGDYICPRGGLMPPGNDPCGFGETSNPQTLWEYSGYYGCTHPAAPNYNPEATRDDGSCELESVMTICKGQSINLANFYNFNEQPQKPDNLDCSRSIRVLEDNEGVLENYVVSPSTTTTYTYTSYYDSVDPAVSCPPSEQLVKTFTVIVENCDLTICPGESILLSNLVTPAPRVHFGPLGSYGCSMQLIRTISPNDGHVTEIDGTFLVSPDVSTPYLITSYYTPEIESSYCIPGEQTQQVFRVWVQDCESEPNEEISICAGESTTLSNLALPPISPGTDNCTFLSRNIHPNDASVSKTGDTFTLNPSFTTIYTITSRFTPTGIGVNCIPSSEITETVKVVVEDCQILEDEVISICKGETVRLSFDPGIPPPTFPKGYCDDFKLSIEPNDETVQPYVSTRFELTPNTSTSYTVTRFYGPHDNPFGITDDCTPSKKIIKTYHIEVENCEPATNYAPGEYTIEGCIGDVFEFGAFNIFDFCSTVGTVINFDLVRNTPVISNFTELDNCKRRFTISGEGQFIYEGASNSRTPAIAEWKFNIVLKDSCADITDKVTTICKGEEITIDLTPEKLYNGCWLCNVIELEDQSWSVNGVEISNQATLDVSPSETTIYTLTALANSPCLPTNTCAPPIGVMPPPYRNIERTILVNVEDCTEPSLANRYPWLDSLVDFNACEGTTITEYDAGSYTFLHIDSPSGGSLYYQNGTFYCNDAPGYSCVSAYNLSNVTDSFTCGNSTNYIPGCTDSSASNYNPLATINDGSCEYTPTPYTVFSDYPWLSTLVNQNNCNNETITVYDAGSYNFIHIQNDSNGDLYYQNGTFYCSDAPGYSCVSAYNLSLVDDSWICNTSTSILGCTDPNVLNYNPAATEEDGSCEYEATPDCSNYTGTFFFENCGGTSYYFIQMEDRTIFDPYFADGISFTPFEGQQVNFDFVYNTEITTPCSVSEAPITITCIEELRGFVFNDYPWLSDVVDPNNCNGETIWVYDAGSYNFITIQSTSGTDLYYQNGTYYCSDAPGYSCVQAYNLTEVVDNWSCGDEIVEKCYTDDPSSFAWIQEIVNNPSIEPCEPKKIEVLEYDGDLYYAITNGNSCDVGIPPGSGLNIFDCEGKPYCSINIDNLTCNSEIISAARNRQVIWEYESETTQVFDFEDYPWLYSIVNPINCNEQPQFTEYDFGGYAFIYIKTTNGGLLYLNNGTFYCTDEDGQSCLTNYNLVEPTTTWACGNGEFKKFDYVYTICEGESIDLYPDYETVFAFCTCPPCGGGPPGSNPDTPIVSWRPAGICVGSCYPLTVNPTSTSAYSSSAQPVVIGDSGCGSPPGVPGPGSVTNFLVIVKPCSPAKTITTEPVQKLVDPSFKLYPNPTADKVFIDLENMTDEVCQITLLDMQGKILQNTEVTNFENKLEMDVSSYPEGIYLIEFKNSYTTVIEKLMIK